MVLYCIFVLLEENIVDRTQQMEQVSATSFLLCYLYVKTLEENIQFKDTVQTEVVAYWSATQMLWLHQKKHKFEVVWQHLS